MTFRVHIILPLAVSCLAGLTSCGDTGSKGEAPAYSGDFAADTRIFVEEFALSVATCNDSAALAEQGWRAHSAQRLADESAILLAEDAVTTCNDSLAVMGALGPPPSATGSERKPFDRARQACRRKFAAARDYAALIAPMVRGEATPEQDAEFAETYAAATADSGPCAEAILAAGERGGLAWSEIHGALTAAAQRADERSSVKGRD